MDSWWEIPLCARFLDMVKEEIFSGKIVLTFLPKHTPSGFIPELKRACEKKQNIQIRKINLNDCDLSDKKPVESMLFNLFDLDKNTNVFIRKSASEIFKNVDFNPTQVFVFENLQHELLDHFKEFLIDLGRYHAGTSIISRHRFLVIIDPSNFKHDDFMFESGIQKVHYQGIFGKLENLLGCKIFFNQNNELIDSLLNNIIASISKFDVRLMKALSQCDNFLENYPEALLKFAEKNEWNQIKFIEPEKMTDEEKWLRWAEGILDFEGDKVIYHSAYLHIHKKNDDLEKRAWVSGLEILLPLIEEFRQRVLKCNKFVFPFKHQNKNTGELIENKQDFEIGDICYLLQKREVKFRGFSGTEIKKLVQYIELNKDIRNALAHLELPNANKIKKFFHEYDEVDELLNSVELGNR